MVASSRHVFGDIQVFQWRLEATTTYLKTGSKIVAQKSQMGKKGKNRFVRRFALLKIAGQTMRNAI